MARAKGLRFTGTYDASGQPNRWFSGIPARDLDAAEVKGLSDEEYANATGGTDPLYVAATETPPKAPARQRPSRAKKAAAKPAAGTPKVAASAPVVPATAPGSGAEKAAEPAPTP